MARRRSRRVTVCIAPSTKRTSCVANAVPRTHVPSGRCTGAQGIPLRSATSKPGAAALRYEPEVDASVIARGLIAA